MDGVGNDLRRLRNGAKIKDTEEGVLRVLGGNW